MWCDARALEPELRFRHQPGERAGKGLGLIWCEQVDIDLFDHLDGVVGVVDAQRGPVAVQLEHRSDARGADTAPGRHPQHQQSLPTAALQRRAHGLQLNAVRDHDLDPSSGYLMVREPAQVVPRRSSGPVHQQSYRQFIGAHQRRELQHDRACNFGGALVATLDDQATGLLQVDGDDVVEVRQSLAHRLHLPAQISPSRLDWRDLVPQRPVRGAHPYAGPRRAVAVRAAFPATPPVDTSLPTSSERSSAGSRPIDRCRSRWSVLARSMRSTASSRSARNSATRVRSSRRASPCLQSGRDHEDHAEQHEARGEPRAGGVPQHHAHQQRDHGRQHGEPGDPRARRWRRELERRRLVLSRRPGAARHRLGPAVARRRSQWALDPHGPRVPGHGQQVAVDDPGRTQQRRAPDADVGAAGRPYRDVGADVEHGVLHPVAAVVERVALAGESAAAADQSHRGPAPRRDPLGPVSVSVSVSGCSGTRTTVEPALGPCSASDSARAGAELRRSRGQRLVTVAPGGAQVILAKWSARSPTVAPGAGSIVRSTTRPAVDESQWSSHGVGACGRLSPARPVSAARRWW